MTDTNDERQTRPFADTLRDLDKGRISTELGEKLQELIEAVMLVRKPGVLQLTLKVGAAKGDDMVEVTASVVSKTPKTARTSVLFVDDAHNLSRSNPMQPSLPLVGLPSDEDTVTPAQRSSR